MEVGQRTAVIIVGSVSANLYHTEKKEGSKNKTIQVPIKPLSG
jgi:hypothetical protein